MPRFRFPLQAVLRKRELEEEKRRMELTAAQRHSRGRSEQLQWLCCERRESMQEWAQEHEKGIQVEEIMAWQRYIARVDQQVIVAQAKLTECEAKVQEANRELAAASVQKELLASLKDRMYREFLKELDRKEQGESDDRSQHRSRQ